MPLPTGSVPPARGTALAALLFAWVAAGCGSSTSPSNSTDFILLNGNRVANLSLQVDSPSGSQTFTLPVADQGDEAYGPAIRTSYVVMVGQVFTFTATPGTLTVTKTCTVTANMIPQGNDETTGFAVVGLYLAPAQSLGSIECNW